MKKVLMLICMLSTGSLAWAQATAPPLGTAASFAVLGISTVTNTGASVITGDLGLSPPGVSVTGFSLVPGVNRIVVGPPPATGVTDGPGIATGTIHVGDAVALLAHADAAKAYAALLPTAQTCGTNLSGKILGTDPAAVTLSPGVYCFDSSAQLTGTLTLSGNGVYVFQIGSTLTTASNSTVVLTNGALCGNVFWQVGSSATLGTGTIFAGNLIAFTSDTVTTGVSVAGRVFALGAAVTLDTNTITAGACASSGGGGGGDGDDDDRRSCKDDRDKDHHDRDRDHHDKDRDHHDDDHKD
jgi:ice-binding like protein